MGARGEPHRRLRPGRATAASFLRDDAKPRLLETGDDLAREVATGRVRLDDGKGALDGHDQLLMKGERLIATGFTAPQACIWWRDFASRAGFAYDRSRRDPRRQPKAQH